MKNVPSTEFLNKETVLEVIDTAMYAKNLKKTDGFVTVLIPNVVDPRSETGSTRYLYEMFQLELGEHRDVLRPFYEETIFMAMHFIREQTREFDNSLPAIEKPGFASAVLLYDRENENGPSHLKHLGLIVICSCKNRAIQEELCELIAKSLVMKAKTVQANAA